MLRTDSGRLWQKDHFYVTFWMSLIPPLDIQVPPGWKPPVVDNKLSNVILVKIFTRYLKTMIHDFHVLKVTIIRETVNFLFWHRFQRMIFFWIDIIHHICKWHSRSGGRGLFLKKKMYFSEGVPRMWQEYFLAEWSWWLLHYTLSPKLPHVHLFQTNALLCPR